MRAGVLIALLSWLMLGCTAVDKKHQAFQLYLVRHAEKQADAGGDPHLTIAGNQRARKLADWLKDKSITDVWSSDYLRTRETARPFADSVGKKLKIYDPRELESLADQLLKERHNALVVGHSNTTPELAKLLCQCDIEDMDDAEYDRLIVVGIDGWDVKVTNLKQ